MATGFKKLLGLGSGDSGSSSEATEQANQQLNPNKAAFITLGMQGAFELSTQALPSMLSAWMRKRYDQSKQIERIETELLELEAQREATLNPNFSPAKLANPTKRKLSPAPTIEPVVATNTSSIKQPSVVTTQQDRQAQAIAATNTQLPKSATDNQAAVAAIPTQVSNREGNDKAVATKTDIEAFNLDVVAEPLASNSEPPIFATDVIDEAATLEGNSNSSSEVSLSAPSPAFVSTPVETAKVEMTTTEVVNEAVKVETETDTTISLEPQAEKGEEKESNGQETTVITTDQYREDAPEKEKAGLPNASFTPDAVVTPVPEESPQPQAVEQQVETKVVDPMPLPKNQGQGNDAQTQSKPPTVLSPQEQAIFDMFDIIGLN